MSVHHPPEPSDVFRSLGQPNDDLHTMIAPFLDHIQMFNKKGDGDEVS